MQGYMHVSNTNDNSYKVSMCRSQNLEEYAMSYRVMTLGKRHYGIISFVSIISVSSYKLL